MALNFTMGAEAAKARANPFGHLSLDQRKELCMSVLHEVGAQNITEKGRYEIYHSCLLPFGNHPNGDRNPSASINYDKMTGACHVCGGGGWLWWVAAVKGFDTTMRARDWVAEQVGEDRVETIEDLMKFLDLLYDPPPEFERQIPVYDPSVLKPWMFIHPYMTEYRHVPMETMERLRIGYGRMRIPIGNNQFIESDRIVIPHFFDGKLHGWQTRRLIDDGTPKYCSTPDMPKDTTLFNFNRQAERLVVVESPMTVLRHSHHAPVTATFGASVTTRQMDLLRSTRAKRVILWFDNDTAGWNAYEKVGDYLMEHALPWAVQCPFVGDPADLSDERFEWVLANCTVPYALWRRPHGSDLMPLEATDEEVRNFREGAR